MERNLRSVVGIKEESMAEVSIIVPVYQVEKYIRQCVDSILGQTFTDFELILVDDGSTDRSGEICDEYAGMDERVKVIHQKNCGVASARNDGMSRANGCYLCFVDADDWIEETMIEKCISYMKVHDADVLRHGNTMELWDDTKSVNKIILWIILKLEPKGKKDCFLI